MSVLFGSHFVKRKGLVEDYLSREWLLRIFCPIRYRVSRNKWRQAAESARRTRSWSGWVPSENLCAEEYDARTRQMRCLIERRRLSSGMVSVLAWMMSRTLEKPPA